MANNDSLIYEDSLDDMSEERTSPSLRRIRSKNPIDSYDVIVCIPNLKEQQYLETALSNISLRACFVSTVEELVDIYRHYVPGVILVHKALQLQQSYSIPDVLSKVKVEQPRRVILFSDRDDDRIDDYLRDYKYDDYISNIHQESEFLFRVSTNHRDYQVLLNNHSQQRDASILLELSQTLASSLDLQLILHMVSRLVADVLKVERCAIVILDNDQENAVMVAASEDRKVKDVRINLTDYPEIRQCISSREPLIIENVREHPLFASLKEDNNQIEHLRLMALFPIIFEDKVSGLLFLRSHKNSRRLSEHEIQFGRIVASACAVSIRNARLFDLFKNQKEHIEDMRLAAEERFESLKKYEDFFEYAASGMAIVGLDGKILYINRQGRQTLGHADEKLRGINFLDFMLGEKEHVWNTMVDDVRHGDFNNEMDIVVRRFDGKQRVLSLSIGGVGQETGLLILSFRDITNTREMQIELRTTKEFLENLIDNSLDAIIAADMRGNVMLFNKRAEDIYSFTAEEVIGKIHVSQLYHQKGAVDIMRLLRSEMGGGVGRLEAQKRTLKNAYGENVPVMMTASIIYENGEEVATVGVFTDLRERQKLEKALSEAQEKLIRGQKARVAAELAGMAAHELNQPLTSVLGYAEILLHKIPPQQSKILKHVQTIHTQAERMAEIVRKIGQITNYKTRSYTSKTRILSLNESAQAPIDDTEKKQVKHYQRSAKTAPKLSLKDIEQAQKSSTEQPDISKILRLDSIDKPIKKKQNFSRQTIKVKSVLENTEEHQIVSKESPKSEVSEKTDTFKNEFSLLSRHNSSAEEDKS